MFQKPIFVLLVMCTVQKKEKKKALNGVFFFLLPVWWSTLVLLVLSAVDGCVQHIKVVKYFLSLSVKCFSLSLFSLT